MKRFLVVLCVTGCLLADTKGENTTHRDFQIIRHDINQVEICVSNYGKFGQDESGNNSGCWWPIGTNDTYIFGAGVWFGTINSVSGDSLVSTGYIPNNGFSEMGPGLSGMASNDPEAIIYIYPSTWPPPSGTFPMAPQANLSHQDSWCCFNDSDAVLHQAGTPIGVEIYQTVYVWDIPDIEDVAWFFLDVKNVAGSMLNDCYISVTTDCDIGTNASNDVCTGIIARDYIIGSDTVFVDNVGYQWQTTAAPSGAIGFDLLQTPFDLVPGEDKDNDGILDQYERDSAYYANNLPPSMWDVDLDGVPDWRDASENPQIGMTALKQFTLAAEPLFDPARYMTLAGYDFQTGIYEPYDTLIPAPTDQRFLLASGPFDLAPDSSVTIAFAIFFADWYNIYQSPDTALAPVDEIVQLYYDMYWFLYTGIEENFELRNANCGISISPNPVAYSGNVCFSLNQSGDATLQLYNTLGQLVATLFEGSTSAGNNELRLDVSNLAHGTYFLVLETSKQSKTQSFVVVR